MKRFVPGMVLSAALAAAALAADEPKAVTLTVALRDGTRAHGASDLKTLEVQTAYGTLTVPLDHILGIRFSRGDDPDLKSRIGRLIEQLGDRDFQKRQAAHAELEKIGAPARRALQEATRSTDAEIVTRAETLLSQLGSSDETDLPFDEIETRLFTIRGVVKLDALQLNTRHGALKILRKELLMATVTPADAPEWLAQGLVAHWKLDEQDGDLARDSAPGKFDGKLEGFAAANPWRAGVAGNALAFDGNASCVLIANSTEALNPGKRDWTIAVWIKTRGAAGLSGQVVIAKNGGGQGAGGPDRDLPLRIINNGGRVVFGVSGPHFGVDIIGNTNVNDDKWHHIAGVRAGKKLRLYVDGKLEAETNDPQVPDEIISSHPVYLGRNDLWDGWAFTRFNGLMDDVRIYSRALSAEQIRVLAALR
jgi:hypothetical protein